MVDVVVGSNTVDYILTVCIVWLIMIGFFMLLTLEVMLLIGVIFPVLIILLLRNSRNRTRIIEDRI
jgi:Flp pilus assembly protein TadB